MGLTAKTVEKLAKAANPGLTNDGRGLYFKVTKGGSASWIFRYKMNGRARDMGLGPYPEIGLAEAREKATRARLLQLAGEDPLDARRAEEARQKAELQPAVTFESEAKAYITAHRTGWKSDKHAQQWENTLATYAYPLIGRLEPSAVTTAHVLRILSGIWYEKTETASRVRNRIELVLDAAKAKGLRDGENPARWRGHLDKLLPKRSNVQKVKNHPALPWDEVPHFVSRIRAIPGFTCRAIETTIATGMRTNEVLRARWEEIDFDRKVWTVPAARMKRERDHRVPLSDQLLCLLQSLPRIERSPYVFPGQKPNTPLSNMSMLMALRRMGFAQITMHGFRSSFRDWAAEATNHQREVCEQALAHKIANEVEAAYRRGDLFEKRQRLMQEWSDFIFSGAAESEVS